MRVAPLPSSLATITYEVPVTLAGMDTYAIVALAAAGPATAATPAASTSMVRDFI